MWLEENLKSLQASFKVSRRRKDDADRKIRLNETLIDCLLLAKEDDGMFI